MMTLIMTDSDVAKKKKKKKKPEYFKLVGIGMDQNFGEDERHQIAKLACKQ